MAARPPNYAGYSSDPQTACGSGVASAPPSASTDGQTSRPRYSNKSTCCRRRPGVMNATNHWRISGLIASDRTSSPEHRQCAWRGVLKTYRLRRPALAGRLNSSIGHVRPRDLDYRQAPPAACNRDRQPGRYTALPGPRGRQMAGADSRFTSRRRDQPMGNYGMDSQSMRLQATSRRWKAAASACSTSSTRPCGFQTASANVFFNVRYVHRNKSTCTEDDGPRLAQHQSRTATVPAAARGLARPRPGRAGGLLP